MQIEHRRTKKLTVAFHFQFANQTAWKCDDCRKTGLEQKRACGWLDADSHRSRSVVWGRHGCCTFSCPVSYITQESLALLERYRLWKIFGGQFIENRPAREVDAFALLEQEFRREAKRHYDEH